VALNATERIIRLGSCKRSAAELVPDLPVFGGHVERFLRQFPDYAGWRVERVPLAPHVPQDVRQEIARQGSLVDDLDDLTGGAVSGYSGCPFFRASFFPRAFFRTTSAGRAGSGECLRPSRGGRRGRRSLRASETGERWPRAICTASSAANMALATAVTSQSRCWPPRCRRPVQRTIVWPTVAELFSLRPLAGLPAFR